MIGKTENHKGRLPLALLAAVSLCTGAFACGDSSKDSDSSPRTVRSPANPAPSSAGTDDDIPAYGHEASAEDKRAITVLVKRYYAAAATSDGQTACALLYSNIAKSVPEDYGRRPGPTYSRGKTCAVVMTKTFQHIPGPRAAISATEVTDVRLYNNAGFAELRSKLTPRGEIYVERQGKSWTIGAILGEEQAGRS